MPQRHPSARSFATRLLATCLSGSLLSGLTVSAAAFSSAASARPVALGQPPGEGLLWPTQATPSQPTGDKRDNLDRLLDALQAAPSEPAAAMLEDQLLHRWLQAGTPAVTLLISRGLRSLQAGQDDDAIDCFSDAITLAPDLAEAWHQRAIARYHGGDVAGAVRDLQETVAREPRNFAAFRTLADIAAAREDWKAAYAAWQKVMLLDPKTPGGEDRLRELKRHAVGEDT